MSPQTVGRDTGTLRTACEDRGANAPRCFPQPLSEAQRSVFPPLPVGIGDVLCVHGVDILHDLQKFFPQIPSLIKQHRRAKENSPHSARSFCAPPTPVLHFLSLGRR